MAPFADHLGINPKEFMSWRPLFSNFKSKVLLVEGPIDKQYFDFFQSQNLCIEPLDSDIEIVPYGGKSTLKNVLLLKFVLSRFDNVYLTYDLDAHGECSKSLETLGLKENVDFLPIGLADGGEDIEGLLPKSVLSSVHSKETDLVRRSSSVNNEDRKKAKEALKQRFLEEFKSRVDYSEEDLKEFKKVIKIINKAFNNKIKK